MKKEDVTVKENFKHSSQKDAAKGFGGKFGVQSDRKDKVGDDSVVHVYTCCVIYMSCVYIQVHDCIDITVPFKSVLIGKIGTAKSILSVEVFHFVVP